MCIYIYIHGVPPRRLRPRRGQGRHRLHDRGQDAENDGEGSGITISYLIVIVMFIIISIMMISSSSSSGSCIIITSMLLFVVFVIATNPRTSGKHRSDLWPR